MRVLDIISENQQVLSPGKLTKDINRFNNLINNIRTEKPLYLSNGESITIDPTEADRLVDLQANNQFAGRIVLKTNDNRIFPIGAFLKTKDYGGEAIPPGQELTTAPTKSGAKLKPKDIGLHDQQIPASKLGAVLAGNQALAQTNVGMAVQKLANDISTKQSVILPQGLHDVEIKAINDDAGEYLGVWALINDYTDFANKSDFLKWLGAPVSSLTLMFPAAKNESIADSYALINNRSGHQINISSKGKAGGAPPAISGLKIPEHIAKKSQYAVPVQFIQLCQNTSLPQPITVSQPFRVMNMLLELKPEVIPPEYAQFLPWPQDIVAQVNDSLKNKTPLPQYQHLWQHINFKNQNNTDGGKLTHVVKTSVKDIFNSGKIPEFAPAILEILDFNFIQQDATIKKGIMTFKTNWPAKINGRVTVESKSGASDPTKGSFSFKLHF
jgi:hypothetical protein